MAPPPLIQLKDISLTFGGTPLLSGVELSVSAGERVCLIGRNGAGKTTTLKSIMGLMGRTRGSVTFKGEELLNRPAHVRFALGLAYVPEERRIVQGLSVRENLRLGLVASRQKKREAELIDEIAMIFPRLAERMDQDAVTMSGGEQQMLAIGRALTLNPKVLLLDEPTEGLAPIIVEELLKAIGTITRSGGICSIIVEQNAQKILGLADRVVILERGMIVHDAASSALKADRSVLERHLGVAATKKH